MSAKKAKELGLKPLATHQGLRHHRPRPQATWAWARCPPPRRRCSAPAGRRPTSPVRAERSLRRAGLRGQQGAGHRPGQGQRQRRRHRHRAPDRCVRRPHPGDAAARDAAARREEGRGRAVHRRRHGGFPCRRTRLSAQNESNATRQGEHMAKKVAYVTGGMGGIGTAICQRLHKEGFTVIAGCGPTRDFTSGWASRRRRATRSTPRSATSATGIPRSRPSPRPRPSTAASTCWSTTPASRATACS
jgi:hypothetical protein